MHLLCGLEANLSNHVNACDATNQGFASAYSVTLPKISVYLHPFSVHLLHLLLQLLLQYLVRQKAAARPGTPTLGAWLNNCGHVKAAMAAFAAGELSPPVSALSAAATQLRLTHAEAGAAAQASLCQNGTGLPAMLPKGWQAHVQALAPRQSTASEVSRRARNARLEDAGSMQPQLLLEGPAGPLSAAERAAESALVAVNGKAVQRQLVAGWQSGESDTDREDESDWQVLFSRSSDTAAAVDDSQQLAVVTASDTVVNARATGGSLTAVSSDVRLAALTSALGPTGANGSLSLAAEPPADLTLLTWNIWAAVCPFGMQ